MAIRARQLAEIHVVGSSSALESYCCVCMTRAGARVAGQDEEEHYHDKAKDDSTELQRCSSWYRYRKMSLL